MSWYENNDSEDVLEMDVGEDLEDVGRTASPQPRTHFNFDFANSTSSAPTQSTDSSTTKQPKQPPAQPKKKRAVLIVIHSNFRTYGGPRTRQVAPEDLVGFFVGDIDTGRGHIFRYVKHSQNDDSSRRRRLKLARDIYRDKFFNERNLVPFDTVDTVMCETEGDMIVRAAHVLSTYDLAYVKLPKQVRWVLQSFSSISPQIKFLNMPAHAKAAKVLVHTATCGSRPNHNTVVCEICLFHCYREQLIAN